jgi:hypothetical protein
MSRKHTQADGTGEPLGLSRVRRGVGSSCCPGSDCTACGCHISSATTVPSSSSNRVLIRAFQQRSRVYIQAPSPLPTPTPRPSTTATTTPQHYVSHDQSARETWSVISPAHTGTDPAPASPHRSAHVLTPAVRHTSHAVGVTRSLDDHRHCRRLQRTERLDRPVYIPVTYTFCDLYHADLGEC